MEAARLARASLLCPLFGLRRALSFWVDQQTSPITACLLLTIVKGAISPTWIVRRRDGEYTGVGDIRAYNRSLWCVRSPPVRPQRQPD